MKLHDEVTANSERAARDQPPLMQQLGRTLTAFKQAYTAELGVSALAAWVLSLLAHRDGRSQHELTEAMRVDASMITRTVQEMEGEHGWIRRERDPRDNRLVRVYLTDSGRERSAGLSECVAAIEQRLTRDLTPEQVQELGRTLRILEIAARPDQEAPAR